MTNLRNTLAIALTAATLGLGALAASPASAHVFYGGQFHGGGFHRDFGRMGHRDFDWGHRRFGWGYGHCWGFGLCYGWGREHRWGYSWGGYRRFIDVGVAEGPPVCPPGTRLGYLGKHCWPIHRPHY